MPSFADHFSGHAADYARHRPSYPDALFAYLADQCPTHDLAWDCGTGTGQAAIALADAFDQVVATDASAEQIEQAAEHPQVTYRVALAEQSGLDPASVDLVTVATALHWFDTARFYDEVRRVLKPGGILAVWTYDLVRMAPDEPNAERFNMLIDHFYTERVGPYWPPEREHIDAQYESLPFPFDELDPPALTLTEKWTLDQFLGYLRTWSATRRYIEAEGVDPVQADEPELRDAWGEPDTVRTLHWPIHLRAGHKPQG